MKTIISKVMIILLILNLIAPFSAFASNEIVLYNCGEEVRLTNGLYESNGKIYIHEKELDRINLYYDSNVISNSEDTIIMELYPGSSIVIVNGTSITYPKSTVQSGDYIYVCLDLIAMFFSEQYDITDTTINLWISDSNTDFVRGIISLPSGNVAPAGGIELEVFVAEIPNGAMSGGYGSTSSSVYYSEIGSPGYKDSEHKPMYETGSNKSNNFLEYNRIVTNTVIIPEGESQVEYTMSAYGDDLYKCIIGYYTELNGKIYYDKQTYKGNERLYNFEITEAKTSISGAISIPEIADSDVKFRVIAHSSRYDFTYDGIILEGKKTAAYNIEVDKNATYSIEVIFIDGEYLRTTSDEKVSVESNSIEGIDITVEAANKYIANISLPSDYIFNGNIFDVKVYLQMASSPYYILDSETVSFDENTKSSGVELFNDMNRKKVICYYVLSGGYNGLFQFGHYSEDGTSFDIDNADILTATDTSIDIELLKSKEIAVNFTLPNDEVAEEDIRISATPMLVQAPLTTTGMAVVTSPTVKEDEGEDVNRIENITGDNETIVNYPTGGDDILGVTPIISAGDIITYKPNTGDDKISLLSVGTLSSGGSSAGGSPGGGGGSSIAPPVSLAPPTIEKGKCTGDETIVIPDENGYSYIVRMNVSGGNDKYYNKIYYNTLATTSLAKRASRVTNETDIINIELVKQYYISGNINAVGFEDSHNRITVASQRSETIIEDIYDCDFSIYTEIYGVGNYGMYVPAEFEKYVLRLNSFATGRTIYYHPDECVDDLPESKVLTVKHDMADIDFDYSGYNPDTPLMIDLTRSMGEWRVRLSNIGDFDTDTIDLYISFYNKQGAMTNLIREYAGIIEGRSVNEIYVTVPDSYLTNVETIKVMAWNNLKPMANVLELSNTSINEKMIASAYMQVGETTVYHRGEEHVVDIAPIMVDGVLYAPVRAIAETLGWTVNRINDDAETIKITDQNGYVIILTENEIKAKIDGDTVSLLNPPIVVNGRMMIPFENIASYMGYECVQNNDFGTIAVYDSIDWKVKYIFENNMVPDVLKNSLVEERLTRKELAAIIVNTYETINCKTIDIERKPFYDCDDENVLKACSLGIIGGFEDSTFKPDSLLTRAEYSKAMYSLLNLVGLNVQFDKVNTTDYDDITDSHWASGYVYGLNEIGIFDGIFDGLFKPENAITIREALAILGNAYKELKQSEFTDIPNTHPYILAITNVSNKGIMVGYEDGTFMPEHRMMRSEFTALITRMDGEEIRQSQTFSCLDVPQNHWASGCIEYCINKGVMKLENNVFRPNVEITIGETIDALMNYLGFAPTLDIQEKLIQAEKIGLLNGVVDEITIEEPCLRGMMAQLINNALNIDMENL